MSEVVLEVVALRFASVVVFVLYLPPLGGCRGDGRDVGVREVGGGPSIAKRLFAILCGGNEVAPVNHQRI